MKKLFNKLRCALTFHDVYSWASGREKAGPDATSVCFPMPGDSQRDVLMKFANWTRQRCRRCDWTYPKEAKK